MTRPTTILLALLVSTPALAAKGAGVEVPELPGAWGADPADLRDGPAADDPWWHVFGDPRLDALLAEGLDGNLDLAAARDRVIQARSLEWQNAAGFTPTLSFDTNLSGQPASLRFAALSGGAADDVDGFYYQGSAGFNAAWNLDIFGRNILGVQAAHQDAAAAEEDADGAAVSLSSAIVGAWFDLAAAEQRLAVLAKQVKANEELVEIVELRFENGEASAVDVLQQRNNLAATRAQLPPLRASREVAGQRLAVLLGRSPSEPIAAVPTALPDLPAAPAVGRPTDLVDHRPDLRAAERRLTSSWQRRMAAERTFLPTLAVSANAGWSFTNNAGSEALFGRSGSDSTVQLFQQLESFIQTINPDFAFDYPDTGSSEPPGFQQWFSWSVGAQLSVPIFGGGRNIGALKQARAAERIAATTLAKTQLEAVAAVEGAMVGDVEQRRRLEAVRTQEQAAVDAFLAARDRYAAGVGDYLAVLSSLVAAQNAQFQAVQAHRDALSARIQLHEAVGGTWTHDLSGGSR